MIMTGIRYHLHSTMNYVTFFLNVHLPLQNQNCAYEEKGLSLRNVQCVKCFDERTASHITYIVPSVDNNIYMRVSDRDIHRAGYED